MTGMTKPKLYTASTLRHADLWRRLRDEWPDIEFTANWIDEKDNWSGPDIATVAQNAWVGNESNVSKSDAVLVYADMHDKLRGGLIEAGMGIVLRKFVIVVGSHSSYGTWQYHPSVYRVPLMASARTLILAHAENKHS